MKRKLLVLLAVMAMLIWASMAGATIVCLDSTDPSEIFSSPAGGLAANATFSLSSIDPVNHTATLTILLKNTGTTDIGNSAQELTALFWFSSNPALDQNATGAAANYVGKIIQGKPIVDQSGSWPNPINGQWGYKEGLLGSAPNNANQGISTAGLGLFGLASAVDTFQSATDFVGNQDFGIVPSAYTAANANPALQGYLLTQDSMEFIFPGTKLTDLDQYCLDMNTISFQYGTTLDDTNLVVPIPPSALLMGSGLLGLGLVGWRRKSFIRK